MENYASAGQKLEHNGQVYYQAGKAGKYDKAGIDINYSVGSHNVRSETGGEYVMRNRRESKFDVNIDIAKNGFGTNNRKYNLLEAIVHESYLHGNSYADDFMDNGRSDRSNLPKQFRSMGIHSDHYHISQGAIYDPTNKDVMNFTSKGFNILEQASKDWNLNFSDTQIRTHMWNFSGPLINVNQKSGKLEYSKTPK